MRPHPRFGSRLLWAGAAAAIAGLALFSFHGLGASLVQAIAAGWESVEGLSQALWWLLGGLIPALWALKLLATLARRALNPRKAAAQEKARPGRMRQIQGLLERGPQSRYAQEETSALLRTLAIDLIALRRDVTEEEARQILLSDGADEEAVLRPLLADAPFATHGGPTDAGRDAPATPEAFLEGVERKLDALTAYAQPFPTRGLP